VPTLPSLHPPSLQRFDEGAFGAAIVDVKSLMGRALIFTFIIIIIIIITFRENDH